MPDPFPEHLLTPKQTEVVTELRRQYPAGTIENRSGSPVFVSNTLSGLFTMDLISLKLTFSKRA